MPLTLITGPPNGGKTGRAYARLREALANRESCALLLPSLPDVERASAELAETGPVGLQIAQFDRYLSARWSIYGDGRALVTDAQREALIRSALKQARGRLAGRAAAPGMSALLTRLVRESAAERPGTPPTGEDAAEVVAVVERYREALGDLGLVEPLEAYEFLASHLEREHDLLVAHRFADIARHQLSYLSAVARTPSEVLVTLTWEADSPATAASGRVVERMLAEGVTHEEVRGSYRTVLELEEVARRLFRPAGDPLPEPRDVALCLCGEMEDEIERAAAEAASLVRNGVAAENVAIVYREPWSKAMALRRALADEGLSCDIDIERPLSAFAFTRATMHLLAFAMTGAREDLLAWLRSPFSGVEADDVAALEYGWRSKRVRHVERLKSDVARACEGAGGATRLAARLAASAIDDGWAAAFDGLLSYMLSAAHPGDARTDLAAEDDARAFSRMGHIVREASEVTPPLAAPDLLAALSSATLGPGRTEQPGRVQITSVERARSRRFAAVILGGLTADEFPKSGVDDVRATGAIGEAARALGIEPDDERDARERADFYSVVTRPRKRLVLLTHEMSADGEPPAPSPFWSEVIGLYQTSDAENVLPPFVERYARTEDASPGEVRSLAQRLGGCSATGAPDSCSREVFSPGELEAYVACPAKWFRDRMLRPESPDARFSALESGRLVHDVLRDTIAGMQDAGHGRVTSATLPLAEEMAREAFARELGRYAAPEGLEETAILQRAMRAVEAFLRREAVFAPRLRPVELEYGFGFGEDDDAPVDVGGLLLRGRIDRVDDAGGGLLITDYKSGNISPHSAFERLGLLQLQLYTAVLTAKGMPVVGAVYRSLRNGKLGGFHMADAFSQGELPGSTPVDPDTFEATITSAVARAREAARGIVGGAFEPHGDPRTCRNCALAPGCREAS